MVEHSAYTRTAGGSSPSASTGPHCLCGSDLAVSCSEAVAVAATIGVATGRSDARCWEVGVGPRHSGCRFHYVSPVRIRSSDRWVSRPTCAPRLTVRHWLPNPEIRVRFLGRVPLSNVWGCRLTGRTPRSHRGNRGSNPLSSTFGRYDCDAHYGGVAADRTGADRVALMTSHFTPAKSHETGTVSPSASLAQLVERSYGKAEVGSSNLPGGSAFKRTRTRAEVA